MIATIIKLQFMTNYYGDWLESRPRNLILNN